MARKSAVVLSERPVDESRPGHARRIESLIAYLENEGYTVRNVAVTRGVAGRVTRAFAVLRVAAVRKQLVEGDVVYVAGLGGAHMLWLAKRLASRFEVVFDSCDSWNLQLSTRRAEGGAIFPIRVGRWMIGRAGRLAAVSYISLRDASADTDLVRVATTVVPQAPIAELNGVEPVRYPLTRIVIPADFGSFHNRVRADSVLNAVAVIAAEARDVRFEVFGLIPEGFEVPSPLIYRDWVDNLREIYGGSTGVVVTNRAGSGVPNKLLEARQSQRPVVLHASFQSLDLTGPGLYYFETEAELIQAIRNMISGVSAATGVITHDTHDS